MGIINGNKCSSKTREKDQHFKMTLSIYHDICVFQDVCTTIAVLLQYMCLVVFFLMLAEAVEIAFVVLYVFTTESRLKWILPLAWCMSLVIFSPVLVSLKIFTRKPFQMLMFFYLSHLSLYTVLIITSDVYLFSILWSILK
jgi:hypothetical protein